MKIGLMEGGELKPISVPNNKKIEIWTLVQVDIQS